MSPEPSFDVRAHVSPEEWQARVDLAACYRLVALYRWEDLVFTHISATTGCSPSVPPSPTRS